MKDFIKKRIREELIDGQNMGKGLQLACNTMSVATYKEGMRLLVNAIGTPEQNPKLWARITKPLNNWKQEDTSIGDEVKTGGMSGDSMVDESNTWWAAIQSTICEQGSDGLNEDSLSLPERTSFKGYKLGDIISGDKLDDLSGNLVGNDKNNYMLTQQNLSKYPYTRQDLIDLDPEYADEEIWRLESMKQNFNKLPPIPQEGDGMHRIIAAKELGLKTILMWKKI